MEIHLLKFTAALAILWLLYKLFLENDNRHQFKRFYLLASIVFAFSVPSITFTEYVEPVQIENFQTSFESVFVPQIEEESQVNYLPIILWSLYGLGVLLFSVKFIYNLIRIFNKVRKNETHKSQSFIYVLLNDLVIPHSFFSYIFLNKQSYKTDQVPNEVLIHEQTHAKQKHSIDVLLIELLQIVLWFHPLIYVIKYAIKLNHEFIADKAVINQGIKPSEYQQLLLAFSSNASKNLPRDFEMTSAINYSSIKKRFTVMNTQTSKTRIWLSTILLVPIVAILFYNFSSRDYVVNTSQAKYDSVQTEKILNVFINSKDQILINEVIENYESLENLLRQFPKEDYILKFTSDKFASDDLTIKVLALFTSHNIFTTEQPNQSQTQQKATIKDIEEYNELAKKINSIPKDNRIEKQVDLEKLFRIHDRMTNEQKEKNEPFPHLNIYESEKYKMNLSQYGTNVKQKDTMSIILRPILEIKEDNSLWLNGSSTNLSSIQNDFNKIVKNNKSVLDLKSSKPLSYKFINEIIQAIGDNIITINVRLGDAQVYDESNHSVESSVQLIEEQEIIEKINIHIDKDLNLFLNDKNIQLENLTEKVNELNTHLSIDDKRKFLRATISYEDNSQMELVKRITVLLPKYCNIYTINSSNIEVIKKYKLAKTNFEPYAGKSLEEAKKMHENETYDFSVKKQKADSPWKFSSGEVTYIEDDEKPIEVKITKEELKEYNDIVKKFNALPEDRRIIKKVEFERIAYIYFHLDEEQKKKAEIFPNFPPLPQKPENTPAQKTEKYK